MGISADSLTAIRRFFRRSQYHHAPVIPAAGYGGYEGIGAYGGALGYDLLNSNMGGGYGTDHARIEQDLISRFIDYEDQDDSPLISSALDIYADDASQSDSSQKKTIWVESPDEDIRMDLNNLLHRVLRVEERIWGEIRSLCKYGNEYSELVVRDGDGVLAKNHMASPTCRRIEIPAEIGKYFQREMNSPETIGYIHDPRGMFRISTNEFINELAGRISGNITNHGQPLTCSVFEGWEVVHMRLLGKKPESIYGFGIGEPARWIYKRLVLLEDSIIMHRLTRAPSRYAFYIDVSGIPPQEAKSYLSMVKQGMKRQKFVNPATGKVDTKYNPMSPDEDFFLPVRDGRETTRVESLAGPVYDAIEDIKYFENKLFAALKVPKPFLTYEESTAKTHLSAEDARFARTILRIQREIKNAYRKVCEVHLAARGINPSAVDFTIEMTIPSAIFELAQLEIRNAEIELANNFRDWVPDEWIMNHILGFSEDQVKEMREMKRRQDEGEEGGGAGGGAAGSIASALAKRGSPTGKDSRGSAGESRAIKDAKIIQERIEELAANDKMFAHRWKELTDRVKDVQSMLKTSGAQASARLRR